MAVIGYCETCRRNTYIGDHEDRTCPACNRALSATRLEPGRAKVIALNESRFRAQNEAATKASRRDCPVVCECGVVGCTAPISVPTDAYETVRAHPARFIVVPDHVIPETERIVEKTGSYVVIEKIGEARDKAIAQA